MMATADMIGRLGRGAAAGLVGTLALQVLRTASERGLPDTMPPIRQDPGEFMVERARDALPAAFTSRIPPLGATLAAQAFAAGYGVSAGAAYGFLRPTGGELIVDGLLLGTGTWAAGYLGWLPALGLMPGVLQQDRREALGPVVRHAMFGLAVVATYRALVTDRSGLASGSSRIG